MKNCLTSGIIKWIFMVENISDKELFEKSKSLSFSTRSGICCVENTRNTQSYSCVFLLAAARLSRKIRLFLYFQISPIQGKIKTLEPVFHNRRMPDGRGIFLACKAKKYRQYFVYCKLFQHSRSRKGPLRRRQTVVNTGSWIVSIQV